MVMLTSVRPIVENGATVWAPSTKQKWAAIDDGVQTDIIKCAMRVGHERRPCTHAVLDEWGVKPMHMRMHVYICCHSCPSINAIGPAPLRGRLKNINRSTMLWSIIRKISLLDMQLR
jgi:hypothetical protein